MLAFSRRAPCHRVYAAARRPVPQGHALQRAPRALRGAPRSCCSAFSGSAADATQVWRVPPELRYHERKQGLAGHSLARARHEASLMLFLLYIVAGGRFSDPQLEEDDQGRCYWRVWQHCKPPPIHGADTWCGAGGRGPAGGLIARKYDNMRPSNIREMDAFPIPPRHHESSLTIQQSMQLPLLVSVDKRKARDSRLAACISPAPDAPPPHHHCTPALLHVTPLVHARSLRPVRCTARTSPLRCSCWALSAPRRPWRAWPWSWRTPYTPCCAR